MNLAMTRTLGATPIASFAFVVILVLAAGAVSHGLLTDDALRLWAGASTAADGQVPIGRIVAAYPTLPFLSTTLVAWLAPAATPAPALVAASLFALLAAFCFLSFRRAGLPIAAAGMFTGLVAFHPALLRAVVAGPSDMFLAVFLLMLCLALFSLRARSGTSEVMAVGLALMALAFSHPMGAAFAFAAIPFLAFAVRPLLVERSAFNVVIALIFPAFFAVGAFSYVSWIFPGDGWSILRGTDREPLALERGGRANAQRRSGQVSDAVCELGDDGRAVGRSASRRGHACARLSASAARDTCCDLCRHHRRGDSDQRLEWIFRRSRSLTGCGSRIGRGYRYSRTACARTAWPDHGAAHAGMAGRHHEFDAMSIQSLSIIFAPPSDTARASGSTH